MNWFRDRMRNFWLRSSQPRPSLEEEIQLIAYFLWKKDGKPDNKSDYYWEKAIQTIQYNRLPTIYKPYYLLEKKILEPEQSILKGAIYADFKSKPSLCFYHKDCSTIFPDGFDPKKAGMILIRNWGDYEKWEESRQK